MTASHSGATSHSLHESGLSGCDFVWVVTGSPIRGDVHREALGADFKVLVFTSSAAALERLGSGEPPVVLILDWHMPEVSGVEVCRFIRATFNSAQLPIVIVTATEASADLVEALDAGANDLVANLVSGPELRARVASLARLAKLQSRLSETESKLRLQAAYRERFMATLAHDLRQPLSTIIMGCQVLANVSQHHKAVTVIERQLRAAERMRRMINDLLDSIRHHPELGLPIEKREADFAEVARMALDELRTAHPGRELQLTVDGSCHGYWHADRLAQIVSNLVGNAIAHGEPDSPVYVRLTGEDEALGLSVTNRGQAIPSEVLDGLNEPFGRSRTATRSGDGLGLGLHIVHNIVLAHGGTLSAQNQAGITAVLVRLPRGTSK